MQRRLDERRHFTWRQLERRTPIGDGDIRADDVIADDDPERRERAHQPEIRGRHADLFEGLPQRGVFRPLARIDPPAGQADLPGMVREVVASHGQRDGWTIRTRIQQDQRRRLPGSLGFEMRLPPFRIGSGANRNCASGPGNGELEPLAQERLERGEIHQLIIGLPAVARTEGEGGPA